MRRLHRREVPRLCNRGRRPYAGKVSAVLDGALEFQMSLPGGPEGGSDDGINPEKLFAMGYASRATGQAVTVLAKGDGLDAQKTKVHATVTLNKDDTSFKLGVVLTLTAAGEDPAKLQALAEAAHQICPYSRASRGVIDVEVKVG